MMTAAANQRKPNYLPRPPILRKTFHKDSRLTCSHIVIYQLCRVHSKVISTTLISNLYNLLMRMCQDMSLQSHYMKCHRYRLIKSLKCTWLHLKKKKKMLCKTVYEEYSGSLSSFHHSLAGIIQRLSKNPCLGQQVNHNCI